MRRWHFWSIFIITLINSVSLGLIYSHLGKLARQPAVVPQEIAAGKNTDIIERLNLIQSQLAQIQSAASSVLGAATPTGPTQLSDLLPDISYDISSTSKRYISIPKDVSDPVKVYKEQADFSPVVGQLVPDYKYPYSTKLNNWYRVALSGDITGWVKADSVREVL